MKSMIDARGLFSQTPLLDFAVIYTFNSQHTLQTPDERSLVGEAASLGSMGAVVEHVWTLLFPKNPKIYFCGCEGSNGMPCS